MTPARFDWFLVIDSDPRLDLLDTDRTLKMWNDAETAAGSVRCSSLPQDVVRFHAAVLVAGAHDRDTQRMGRHRYLTPGESAAGLRDRFGAGARFGASTRIRGAGENGAGAAQLSLWRHNGGRGRGRGLRKTPTLHLHILDDCIICVYRFLLEHKYQGEYNL